MRANQTSRTTPYSQQPRGCVCCQLKLNGLTNNISCSYQRHVPLGKLTLNVDVPAAECVLLVLRACHCNVLCVCLASTSLYGLSGPLEDRHKEIFDRLWDTLAEP